MSASAIVNRERIEAMAELLKQLTVPADSEEASLDSDVPSALLPDLYFVLVAICHQTSPQGEPPLVGVIDGQRFAGWDFLREAFLRTARRDPTLFTPARLASMSAGDLSSIIQVAEQPVHLNHVAGRAGLIRDIGARMMALGVDSVTTLYRRADGRLVRDDGNGLLRELAGFYAYRDPIQKKTFYFLALMRNLKLWELRDPESLGAPVDYHEVRGHLRCGTVAINDSALESRIRAGEPVSDEDDIAIRGAVFDAISGIAEITGLTPSRLHYLFWNVFRACCKRDETHCEACPSTCALPERYVALTPEHRRCVFSDVCRSRGESGKVVEHFAQTDFY